ncbi:hypothetical protein L9F63_012844, partial [Diploptera punctata]
MVLQLDFRHNTHRLVVFVLLCLQQVERVISCQRRLAMITMFKRVYMAVPICCSALYTIDTSQVAEYTLNGHASSVCGDTCSTASLCRKFSDDEVTISQLLKMHVHKLVLRHLCCKSHFMQVHTDDPRT